MLVGTEGEEQNHTRPSPASLRTSAVQEARLCTQAYLLTWQIAFRRIAHTQNFKNAAMVPLMIALRTSHTITHVIAHLTTM